MAQKHKHTNQLINETSPYLLQHAHNPVNWLPWNEETLQFASKRNKPLIISVGYSACHWCHVMEKESFENETIATFMNEHFTCIKVDREERPDVDQIYMDAVQLVTQQGGWPLNAFALADGKPFYGGTYFPKDKWLNVLQSISQAYENEYENLLEYANKLTEGITEMGDLKLNTSTPQFDKEQLETAVNRWKKSFDLTYGGNQNAPKFPMPNNYQFLLDYASITKNDELLKFVYLTLDEMAKGGIYDQLGGGFARYSTDVHWKVPHFEKMLYDNSQLIALYSNAYRKSKNPEYKLVVESCIAFCKNELSNKKGIYFSALDADSEGVEGKYYIWKSTELKKVWNDDYDLLSSYFEVDRKGLWKEGDSILLRSKTNEEFAKQNKLELNVLLQKVENGKRQALEARSKRVKPGLDDKALTSWNAMHITALCQAYVALGKTEYLEEAESIANFIDNQQKQANGKLWHTYSTKKSQSAIQGFLDDYCFTIEGYINLYQITSNEHWLSEAVTLLEYVQEHFKNQENRMFYFTDNSEKTLVSKKIEVYDNVIPASNSCMAHNLYALGVYTSNTEWVEQSKSMLNNVAVNVSKYPSGHSNWAKLMLHFTHPSYQLVFTGKNAKAMVETFGKDYYPNTLIAFTTKESALPLFKSRLVNGQTLVYVCQNNACKLPTENIQEGLQLLSYS